jgi:glycosyltransferase involved in cell wall biosynthesis
MKPLLVISCPLETMSGYGARSRDIVKALLQHDKYEIKVIPQRWGNTPWNALDPNNLEDQKLLNTIWRQPQLPRQPDIWIQITVPNEFQPIGKFNIGITAGIETTICDPSWIEGINRMNLTLVSSEHAKKVFETSVFEQRNNVGQTVGHLKLEKPVEVLFEGIDLNKYFHIPDEELEETELIQSLDEIKEDFCFLYVGHWLPGQLGEDRKNTGYTIKSFLEVFKNKKNPPALILKTSQMSTSVMDKEEILKRIDAIKQTVKGTLPNVYLLHGDLDDKDMNDLYNHGKIKAMVSLTKGEGFGRPLLEFSLSKKPIIASNWSGHLDFLQPEYNILVNGNLTNIHPSAVIQNMILAESQWFTPNDGDVANAYKNVYENYNKYLEKSKRQAHYSKTNFSFDKMAEILNNILETKTPKQVELKLPQLKKIELPKLKKAE